MAMRGAYQTQYAAAHAPTGTVLKAGIDGHTIDVKDVIGGEYSMPVPRRAATALIQPNQTILSANNVLFIENSDLRHEVLQFRIPPVANLAIADSMELCFDFSEYGDRGTGLSKGTPIVTFDPKLGAWSLFRNVRIRAHDQAEVRNMDIAPLQHFKTLFQRPEDIQSPLAHTGGIVRPNRTQISHEDRAALLAAARILPTKLDDERLHVRLNLKEILEVLREPNLMPQHLMHGYIIEFTFADPQVWATAVPVSANFARVPFIANTDLTEATLRSLATHHESTREDYGSAAATGGAAGGGAVVGDLNTYNVPLSIIQPIVDGGEGDIATAVNTHPTRYPTYTNPAGLLTFDGFQTAVRAMRWDVRNIRLEYTNFIPGVSIMEVYNQPSYAISLPIRRLNHYYTSLTIQPGTQTHQSIIPIQYKKTSVQSLFVGFHNPKRKHAFTSAHEFINPGQTTHVFHDVLQRGRTGIVRAQFKYGGSKLIPEQAMESTEDMRRYCSEALQRSGFQPNMTNQFPQPFMTYDGFVATRTVAGYAGGVAVPIHGGRGRFFGTTTFPIVFHPSDLTQYARFFEDGDYNSPEVHAAVAANAPNGQSALALDTAVRIVPPVPKISYPSGSIGNAAVRGQDANLDNSNKQVTEGYSRDLSFIEGFGGRFLIGISLASTQADMGPNTFNGLPIALNAMDLHLQISNGFNVARTYPVSVYAVTTELINMTTSGQYSQLD